MISGSGGISRIPTTKLTRLANYFLLGVRLGKTGAWSRVMNRKSSSREEKEEVEVMMNAGDTQAIVDTLCHMRGAALKVGQLISIQDNEFIHPEIHRIFERVRNSANSIPFSQVCRVIEGEFGKDWRVRKGLRNFEEKPFAAASIGQVHRAKLWRKSSRKINQTSAKQSESDGGELLKVCVKIQYPGVDRSIESDLDSFVSLMKWTNLIPFGLYLEEMVEEAKKELRKEVDYLNEARNIAEYNSLLSRSQDLSLNFQLPQVISSCSSRRVLTLEELEGSPVDSFSDSPQQLRNEICTKLLKLTLTELFSWQFMQCDPNWSNFLYNQSLNVINLVDFGACQHFDLKYVASYFKILEAAKFEDFNAILHWSRLCGFLTGFESKDMENAHAQAVMILGKPFTQNTTEFDFSKQNITKKLKSPINTMVNERIQSPPKESYALHRKMSGVFLLCHKLGAKVNCGRIYDEYIGCHSAKFESYLKDNK